MRLALLLLLACLLPAGVRAHEVRPALLQIDESANGAYRILWKQPVTGELAIHLAPHLSSGWLEEPPTSLYSNARFLVKTWEIAPSPIPLEGQALRVEGLDRTITDVLVRIRRADGDVINEKLDARRGTFKIVTHKPTAGAYFPLGVEHILTGVDHLLFLLSLLLLIRSAAAIVKAITAFSVAHGISLAAAALGFTHFSPPLIETLVALTIVYVAFEIVKAHQGHAGVTARNPWIVAFCFGLIHGAAFASTLTEIGLPKNAMPAALLLFNLGIEAGQLLFIAVALPLVRFVQKMPQRLATVPAYGIGGLATAWFLTRAAALFS